MQVSPGRVPLSDVPGTLVPVTTPDPAAEIARLRNELRVCDQELVDAHDRISALEGRLEFIRGQYVECRDQLHAATASNDQDASTAASLLSATLTPEQSRQLTVILAALARAQRR